MSEEKPTETPKEKNTWKIAGVILIIAVFVLSAFAGLLVYKNFDQKTQIDELNRRIENLESNSANNNDENSSELLTANIGDPINDWKVKYPKDWDWAKDESLATSTFTSLSGEVKVGMIIYKNATGFGGAGPTSQYTYSNVKVTPLENIDLSLVEAIIEYQCIESEEACGMYYKVTNHEYVSRLVNNSDEFYINLKDGFEYTGYIVDVPEQYNEEIHYSASINIGGLLPASDYFEKVELISAMSTDEYKQAREILLSLSV